MILAIFCAVGADSWFARDKAGFDEAACPVAADRHSWSSILGLLQIVLIAAALYGFNQDWHVEEERPIGSGEDYGAGAPPENGAAAARLSCGALAPLSSRCRRWDSNPQARKGNRF